MKYKLELTLNKPRHEVWRVFDDPNNLDKWQPLLTKVEHLEGITGQPGSVTKLNFKNGEREYFLVERVIHREELQQLDQLFQNEFADNTNKNTFLEKGNNATLWKVEVEFKFKTLFMRLIGPFVKKRFAASTQRDMDRFKTLIESL